jgi:tetratricopeptide (TPR) repeat protein
MRQAVLANAAALIGGLFVLSPALAPLSAQAAASTCSIDQNKPKELALANFSLSKAQALPIGPARQTVLNQMAKDLLDKPEKFKENPGGYYYMLTQLYTLIAQQPSGVTPTTRGAIGLTTRPGDPFDVVVELDSAYIKMEAAAPTCKADIATSRNNEAWLAVTNKAFSLSQAGQNDSATFYAKRSLMLSHDNPFPHHILATIAQNKNDMPTAITEWKDVVRLSGSDTAYRDIKNASLFYLGVEDLSGAASKTGEAQKSQARDAAGYLKQFLDANPAGPDAPGVMNNLSQAYMLYGDTAAVKAMYSDLIANPSKYNEQILVMGGVAATNAGDPASAEKLFASAVAANPKSRDGLRNLAATRYAQKKFDQMFVPLHTLAEIDPNNYDALMMFAFAAQDLQKDAKTPADKKSWVDTLTKYSGIADKLSAKVEVTGFTRSADKAEVTVNVEQAGEGSGTYTVDMEFLDKSGTVVSSDSQKVGPIAKGEKKTVTLTGKGAGIVSFRYKPLG